MGIYTVAGKKEAAVANHRELPSAHDDMATARPSAANGADEDLLVAIGASDSKQAARANEALGALLAEHRELKGQVVSLAGECQTLAAQVENLASLLKKRQVSNCRNLMERQAMEEGLEEVPSRRDFRPAIHMVANQPTHVSQFDVTSLAQLSLQGSHPAHKEQLIREIMYKDNVDWTAAHKKLFEMDAFNERFYWLQTLPYRVGIVAAVVGGISGILMVFSRPVAELYGTMIAGEELPEGVEKVQDMTRNQVGSWTWSWMEPMIGTASFVLLCAQFARSQAWKLNMRPYTESMQRWRADRLATQYPQYNRGVVRQWAKHMPKVDYKFFPTYRRDLGLKGL